MMKIAVFGSTGFVGANFIKKFENSDLILFNRNNYKDFKSIINNKDIKVVLNFIGKAHDVKKNDNINEYYKINNIFCNELFDSFLKSDAKTFITLSSVKAVADKLSSELSEEYLPNPITHYGKSKLAAENYILSKSIPVNKRFFILRPCMIHGVGNKGNLNMLFKLVQKGIPWPLGSYENKRSFCSIDNLLFVINELIENQQIPSGIYNVADDDSISTNELIDLISISQNKSISIWNVPKFLINLLTIFGDFFRLPLNTERLEKLTQSFVVSNQKIKYAVNKELPINTKEGLMKTLNSFGNSNSN